MSDDKNRATAAALLPLVGGAANVTSVTHCMTRLRLGIRDRSLVQDEALKALPAVLGVVEDDTYQIVLGPGTVARVTPEFAALVEAGVMRREQVRPRPTRRGPERPGPAKPEAPRPPMTPPRPPPTNWPPRAPP